MIRTTLTTLILGALLAPVAFAQPASQPAWFDGPTMPQRSHFSLTRLDSGRVLLVGGRGPGEFQNSTTCRIFDPTSETWLAAAALPSPRQEHSAILLADGRVLVAGGNYFYDGFKRRNAKGTLIYDPQQDRWEKVDEATWTVAGSSSRPRLVSLTDGRVLAYGESQGSDVRVFDPAAGTWSSKGRLAASLAGLDPGSVVTVPGGKLLVVQRFLGGDVRAPRLGFLLDPKTGSVASTPRIPHAERLVSLATGHVLATQQRESALVDPTSGTVTVLPRAPFQLDQLFPQPSGRVLALTKVFGPERVLVFDPEQPGAGWKQPSLAPGKPRRGYEIVSLGDGQLAIFGGRAQPVRLLDLAWPAKSPLTLSPAASSIGLAGVISGAKAKGTSLSSATQSRGELHLAGSGLTGASQVTLGGRKLRILSTSASLIRAAFPSRGLAWGEVRVEVGGESAALPGITLGSKAPRITRVTRSGTEVHLEGQGFGQIMLRVFLDGRSYKVHAYGDSEAFVRVPKDFTFQRAQVEVRGVRSAAFSAKP